jgi:hypothetical protein
LNQILFEYSQAINLLCQTQKCEWTLEKFLRQELKHEIDPAKHDLKNPESKKNIELFAFYTKLCGDILSQICKKNQKFKRTELSDFVKHLVNLLKISKGKLNFLSEFFRYRMV